MAKKILVIDDSALMRRVISDIINESDEYEVVAIAKDGLEGLDMIVSHPYEYSAIILDINMPKLNGLELLKRLQKDHIEQTVIVVSTVAKEGAKETIQALEYGAFDFVTKPENYLETKSIDFKNKIFNMLNVATNSRSSLRRVSMRTGSASSVRSTVTFRKPEDSSKPFFASARRNLNSTRTVEDSSRTSVMHTTGYDSLEHAVKVDGSKYSRVKAGKNKLVALACSTGGPKSLQQVIPMLPANLDAGMVLVQHMPAGFTASLAARLNEMSAINVKEAADGEAIKKGWVYIAPGGKHIRVRKKGMDYVISLSDEAPLDGLKPCANIMYESLTQSNYDEITCVVLTGMGADGTNGIKALSRNHKNIYVIAQDEETSVVYGMPKAIANTGLVNEVVPLNHVAEAITKNVGVS